ncbi:MAG: T9SS type A sorting domain-containing protein [Bacteroidales bacterium]|nr:T9SS type A sorting domain-containing protein [Bacteroidales bacterium]
MKTLKYWHFLFIQLLASLLFILPFKSFSQEYAIPDTYLIKDICHCDIDLDGDYDLILSSNSYALPDSLFIFLNDGIGYLTKISLCRSNGIFVQCGLINDDNYPDIITSDADNILFMQNNGDTTFGEEVILAPTYGGRVIEYITDMDGDSLNDLVYTYSAYYCKWGILKNEGNLQFTDHVIFDDGMGGNLFPRIGSLNDDSLPDACLSYLPTGIHTLMNNGNLTFDTSLLCTNKASPRICKLNLTPPDDILIFSHNTDELILYENLGNNVFMNRNTLPLIDALSSTDIADLNNDGYDDYSFALCLWSGCTDSIYISINDHNWTFYKPQQYYVGPMELFRTGTADLNGDNFSDIIMYGYSPRNAFKILWNDGFGSFSYENPVGINERLNQSTKLKISLKPNPFSTFSLITIKSTINSELKIVINDLYGRPIKEFNAGKIKINEPIEIKWDGRGFSDQEIPKGIYLLIVSDNQHNTHTQKIIKY